MFVIVIAVAVISTLRRRSDPLEIAREFFEQTSSNSHFELLRGVERKVAMEALEHEGEELHPAGKT